MTSFADLPIGSADVLPSLAAAAWPDRAALRTTSRTVTFAELDRAVSRLAFGLRQRLGGDGLTVAVAALPGTDFPTAFYAIVRSGNVAAPVAPDMPSDEFADFLAVTRARAVVLGRAMYERVRQVLPPSLELVLLLDAPAEPGVLTCAELATGGALLVEPRDRDEREPAAILSGLLTHQELKSRAATVNLTANAVVLTTTPTYDPITLSAALLSGATQVLSRHENHPTHHPATHVQTNTGPKAA
ncbi:MAG: class I adenylate-forming enzyme family protein [Actinophytocola sp.]|uniref:AMP-binding protein n=1 Tax=Actinophytocola sp. TaxID=1872138 RepID=UPI003C70769F